MSATFVTAMSREELKEFFLEILQELFARGGLKSLLPKATPPEDEVLINVQEASSVTGLSVNTLYEKTCRREVPHYKKGKRLYFRATELLKWITQGRVKTRTEIQQDAITHTLTRNVKNQAQGRKGSTGKSHNKL